MSDQFVAEIRVFGFNFPPKGWAFCNGQLMPISQNTALFSLLGTTYGGDGKSTFALPDLQGSVAIQQGQGQGLSLLDLGQIGGTQSVTLLNSEMPIHTHTASAANDAAEQAAPAPDRALTRSSPGTPYRPEAAQPGDDGLVALNPQAVQIQGGSLPHNNMPPYLALNYCIALQGIFPQRP